MARPGHPIVSAWAVACRVALTAAAYAGASRLAAQTPAGARIGCYPDATSRLGSVVVPGGYTVTLTQQDSAGGDAEHPCEATIIGGDGSVVYRAGGFRAELDEATGMDVDGDDAPDVVLHLDVGGGNACCWSYVVVSLAPRPRVLFEFDHGGATGFERDSAGRVVLWSWEQGASAGVWAMRVHRFVDGHLADVTPEHCGTIFEPHPRHPHVTRPAGRALDRFRAAGAVTQETADIAEAVESVTLQYVFCRDFGEALRVIQAWWPVPDRTRFIAEFRRTVGAGYPEYQRDLAEWR